MRPRSRLTLKRGLPTIREGHEEMVQDMNQANSQHTPPCAQPQASLSTQDYLLSICQLARPAFPLREPDRDILSLAPMDASKPWLRLHRHRDSDRPLILLTSANHQRAAKGGEVKGESNCANETAGSDSIQGSITTSSDPLEFLYGREGGTGSESGGGDAYRPRSGSFPHATLLPDARRKSSCPDLNLPASAPRQAPMPTEASSDQRKSSPVAMSQRSPLTKKRLNDRSASSHSKNANVPTSVIATSLLSKPHSAPVDWRGKSSRGFDKNNMVSHWIAECRSAWREAMIHACMLPALAEK